MKYPWANDGGFPTAHVLRAALHVASLIGERGAPATDVRASYWRHATGGTFAPPDLALGERLLLDVGLVTDSEGMLVAAPALLAILQGSAEDASASLYLRAVLQARPLPTSRDQHSLAAWEQSVKAVIPDAARREQILTALGRHFNDAHRRLVGAIGEELVAAAARAELEALGHRALARTVRRVSLDSDQLGYDISAPRISGPPRLLEVKATTDQASTELTVHLSRTEADTGAKYSAWALVICRVTDLTQQKGEILGWCAADSLAGLLPTDTQSAKWESAVLTFPAANLISGIPRPTI